ncbi:oligosaccharide flippase family protein [Sphingomonas sp. CL5.1]|uniref:oligosaccharide flippase family protein n=1 Tax=Sphingomonas sp. CL5.1 TaxID=2653203 RepID=UPI001582EA50|nr:oligosaccharide flippase family protein [Sphingomonas sp. CL5.1]QKR99450.1 oligosaccharide flippase family protein [Sphingomonas sp. CL5.1]
MAAGRPMLSRRRLMGPSATLIGTTVAMNVLRIGNTMVLTRLLAPSDYGLIAIIMAIFFVITMITDTGCQAFIVRHERGLERAFLDSVWTIHVLRGVANALLAIALAVPLAALLGKQALAPLMAVAAISLAVDGAASLSLLTALRRKMVRKLSIVDFAAFIIQLVVGLIAAWFLRNAWAIVIAIIAQSIARTAASYLVFPDARQSFRLDRPISIELWRFSRMIAASSTLTLIISQVDRLVLARLFSLQQFGVYSIAGSLASAPTTVAQLYASRIMYPALADTWRAAPERLRKTFYGIRGIVFYGYLFAAGGLIGSASLLIRLLYDPRYAGAASYLHLLAITTAMIMLTRPMNEFLVAIGHVRATLETNVVRVGWLLLAAPLGYFALGPIGIVVALSLIEFPAYLYGAFMLAKLRLYSPSHDLGAFATIAGGVIAGYAGATVGLMVMGSR